MKQKTDTEMEPTIFPIKENIKCMVSCAWQLAKTTFWPDRPLPSGEERFSKRFIKGFLINRADPYQGYLELCQRILLIHEQLPSGHFHVTRELPSQFFHPGNGSGFVLSATLFEDLRQKRISDPLFNHAIKAFCQALLDMAEDPGEEIFRYWLGWFSEREAIFEYRLFYSCCMKSNSLNNNPTP